LARAQEVADLRASLSSEATERRRIEKECEELNARMTDCESRTARLAKELEEVRHERDLLHRQVEEQADGVSDMMRRMQCEEEAKRGLDGEVARACSLQKSLEDRVQKEHDERITADILVQELQIKLGQFEQDMAAMADLKPDLACNHPSGMGSYLEQLRQQLEETVRLVGRHRHGGACNDAAVGPARHESHTQGGKVLTQEGGDTGCPASFVTLTLADGKISEAAVPSDAEASAKEPEEELPAEELLVSEWGAAAPEMANLELEAAARCTDPGWAMAGSAPRAAVPGGRPRPLLELLPQQPHERRYASFTYSLSLVRGLSRSFAGRRGSLLAGGLLAGRRRKRALLRATPAGAALGTPPGHLLA